MLGSYFIFLSCIVGAIGGRPDQLPATSTPPPTFAEALADGREERSSYFSSHGTSGGIPISRVSTTSTHSRFAQIKNVFIF